MRFEISLYVDTWPGNSRCPSEQVLEILQGPLKSTVECKYRHVGKYANHADLYYIHLIHIISKIYSSN